MGHYLGLHNTEFKIVFGGGSFTMIDKHHERCTKKNSGKRNHHGNLYFIHQ